jgi:hypothetical protein
MFSILGSLGQKVYDVAHIKYTNTTAGVPEKGALLQRMAKSRWSPVTLLSDQEYKDMLLEKILSLDAKICLIDEEIERLRNSQNTN